MAPLDDEVNAVARGAQRILHQIRRRMARLTDDYAEARAVLCGADGKPTEAARTWLAKLAKRNRVFGSAYHPDPREHAYRQGRADVVAEMLDATRLDVEELAQLRRQLNERETER